MANLIPLTKREPCPICESHSGKCRKSQDENLILCMTGRDSDYEANGWRFIGNTSCGDWGQYVRRDEFDEQRQREWEDKQAKRKEAREKARESELRKKLSPDQLDETFRKIASHIGLSESSRQKLQDRGLTDAQIDAGCFFDISKNMEIPEVPEGFPGLSFDGKRLWVNTFGIFCPAIGKQGRIIGGQIRSHNNTNGRYRWLTRSHLKNGELPIGFYKPEAVTRTALGICEGFLKARIASYHLEQEFIGAAGGNFLASHQQLDQYIKGVEVVNLYVDAGDALNPQVMNRWKRLISYLENRGIKVLIAWWGQVKKSKPDVDELHLADKPPTINYISPENFFEIATKEQYWQKVAEEQKKLNTLNYKTDMLLNQRFLPDLVGKIPTSGLVNLKSHKGGGKSYQIKKIIAWLRSLGYKIVSLTPRIALGREQAIKWTIDWLGDGDEGGFKVEDIDVDRDTWAEHAQAISLCWDSMWKIASRDFSKTVIIIDESELGFSHLATSSTCKSRRSFIFKMIHRKIKECLSNDGLVILSDADLTDISIDYVKALSPKETKIFTIVNEFKTPPSEVNFYMGKVDEVISEIMDSIELGETIIVATDNQKEAEALERRIIQKFPELSGITEGVIRIDRKATQQDFGKDFVKRPNESIQELKPRVLIYTPSMGVGVSIDFDLESEEKYFDKVYGLFFGQLEPSQCRQMLARYRSPVPRVVWAATSGNISSDISSSPLPDEIKKRMFSFHNQSQMLINLALNLASENEEGLEEDAELLPRLMSQLQSMMGENGEWQNPHIDLYCKLQARRNFGLSQLAVQLYQELKEEGHHILTAEELRESTNEGKQVKEIKKEIEIEESIAISESEDIEPEEAQRIKRSPSRTEEESHKLSKHILKEQLPDVELTPDFVLKASVENCGSWLRKVRLHWDILNEEAIKEKDLRHWKYQLKNFSENVAYLPDIRTYSGQVKAFKDSGLLDLIDLEDCKKEYTLDSPELQKILSNCFRNSKDMKTMLGLTVDKKSQPMKIVGALLRKIGLNLKLNRTEKTEDGGKIRYYVLDSELANDADRKITLEALSRKWEADKQRYTQEVEEKRAIKALQGVEWVTCEGNVYQVLGREGVNLILCRAGECKKIKLNVLEVEPLQETIKPKPKQEDSFEEREIGGIINLLETASNYGKDEFLELMRIIEECKTCTPDLVSRAFDRLEAATRKIISQWAITLPMDDLALALVEF